MQPSKFNFFFQQDDGRVAAYNTRTNSILLLSPLDHKIIAHGNVEELPLGLKCILLEFGYLVEEAFDELLAIRQSLFGARFSRDRLGITLIPTLNCNLSCVYCFEHGKRCPAVMSDEVQEAVLQYAEGAVNSGGSCALVWFGGEPLLHPNIVLAMTEKLRHVMHERKVRFDVSLITNGTLLTQDFLDKFNSLGASGIQITLDGPKHVNDVRKPYVNSSRSSFEDIVNALKLNYSTMSVAVRCNIDRTNVASVELLLEELKQRDLSHLTLYPAPVMDWAGPACRDGSDICYSEIEFAVVRREFDRALERYNFRKSRYNPSAKVNYCGADASNTLTVGPDGSIYKCWNHVGDKGSVVSNILLPSKSTHPINDWLYYDPTSNPNCTDCRVLPLCVGGCPDRARAAHGKRVCDRWKFDVQEAIGNWVRDWYLEVGEPQCQC